MASAQDAPDLDLRIKELEAQLKEQELSDKKSPRALIAQSFLTSLPIVLTIGLGFLANYVQSRSQHQEQLKTLEVQGQLEREKQSRNWRDAEQARREERERSFAMQEREAAAKLFQQDREFVANAQMAGERFAQEQLTLRSQHSAQQAQQGREFFQSLERQKRQTEADLLLQVIKVGDLAVARANIDFLLRAGLVSDPDGRIALAAKEQPPVLPTSSGALEIRVPDSQSAQGRALIERIDRSAPASPGNRSREGPLGALIDAISRERQKYSARELAVILATIEDQTNGSFAVPQDRCTAAFVRALDRGNPPDNVSAEECFELLYGAGTRSGRAMGNRQPGDGFRYRGRGYFLVTGRGWYDRLSASWGVDYLTNPDLLAQPVHAFRSVLTTTENGLRRLRAHPDFGVDDPARFPFAAAIAPVIRSILGRADTAQVAKIAKRTQSIEQLLRESPPSGR